MIVHNDRPVVMETPLELLRRYRITPKEILYIRSNQVYEICNKLDPMPLKGGIEIIGMVTVPYTLDVSRLKEMPQKEIEMVLQCSGNGRSFFSKRVKTSGTQWVKGGMGNIRFKGVPLKVVLKRAGVSPLASFLTIEGKDSPSIPTASDFEKSVPIKEAMDKAILAIEMNGEPIPAVHGGPVRFVLPGFYGTNQVKWVHRLRVEAHETTNVAQAKRYRVPIDIVEPGEKISFTFKNSRPNWYQRIKSFIWEPMGGEKIGLNKKILVKGAAWNDGKAPITDVEVSTDYGMSWKRAEIDMPTSPYAWYLWQCEVSFNKKGVQEIWVRATDALGRTQPIDGTIYWNAKGYEWFGIDKVSIKVI
ncbi:MAG: sulfite reductase [Nitrospirae bacterium]|nr:MAG: sulfite reductase [Nitrospirota bacterium]